MKIHAAEPRIVALALTGAGLGFMRALAKEGKAEGFWRARGVERADLRFASGGRLPPPEDLVRDLGVVLSAFSGTRLRLRGFPYCLLGEGLIRNEYLVDNSGVPAGFKPDFCFSCAFYGRCPGFPAEYAAYAAGRGAGLAVPDRPIEVMLEAESRCQFSCRYCFNRNTFAPRGARTDAFLSGATIKRIIDQLAAWGVPRVRFTGGEPLMREDLPELMDYARASGLAVWVNSNGYRLAGPGSAAGLALRAAGLKTLRIGVCATRGVIRNLDRVIEAVKGLRADRLEFYRPVAVPGGESRSGADDLRVLVDKLLEHRAAGGINAYIANPLPFCFYNTDKVNRVALGAVLGEGNSRFAVDPRGFCKPGYYMEVNMGDCGDLRAAWNSPFSRAVRGQKFLPEGCAGCFYSGKCRGGSRHAAFLAYGDYRAPDPLASYAAPAWRGASRPFVI